MRIPHSLLCSALMLVLLEGCMSLGMSRSERMLHKAHTAFIENRLDQARHLYEEIIARYDTGNPHVYLLASYNLAGVMSRKGEPEHAEKIFHQILASSFDTTGADEGEKKMMRNVYNGYKRSAAFELADMQFRAGNFQQALAYIAMGDTLYTSPHRCGNCAAGGNVGIANMYADCYEGMGKVDEAINILLPHMHKDRLTSNVEISKRCARLLSARYTSEERRRMAEEAYAHIRVEREELHVFGRGDTLVKTYVPVAYIPLFGTEIKLSDTWSAGPGGPAIPDVDASDEVWLSYYRWMFRNDKLYTFLSTGEV